MMASPSPPLATFISSMDLVFSDDEGGAGPSSASSSRNGTPSSSLGMSGETESAASTSKGRMMASSGGRMSVRASKASALAALQLKNKQQAAAAAAASTSAELTPEVKSEYVVEEEPLGAHPSKNSARRAMKLPRAPPLDFSTLRTEAPRLPNPPPRQKPRLFELEEAPVYHPTIEQFAQPMEYIESIAHEARQFGICKIVPPEGWRPTFAIDTETFRFKTRLQQLNSMEATARASLNFLEQLYLFHRQQGSTGMTIPSIGGKPVDMWKLKREVNALGGYAAVTNGRKWTTVGKALGYNVASNTGICSQLKMSYYRIIVPFEEYVKRVKLAGGQAPPDPVKEASHVGDTSDAMKAFASKLADTPKQQPNGSEELLTPMSETGPSRRSQLEPNERVRTASDKLNEALELKPTTRHKTRRPGEACEICTLDHDPDRIVLCDECDRGYHLHCLTPPLKQVPTSQFYCDKCLLNNGADYGFEEGQDHSLYSFRRRADAFKRKWLQDHPLPLSKGKGREDDAPAAEENGDDVWKEQIAIEDHFEREFWRLVESPRETVEVEYGADVASTKDGAGFPNIEVHPLDPYSRDGWNLHNLPILAGSLLRYIKSDISGMTIPWIYVGMVFSTFAWHKEDHYTYSINYHHLGDTKTWYGVPGADDEKLEAAMKQSAPELFDQQPDLMFQLVTLMSPERLKKHDVRVYAADQRPNEFIITFPGAYHSGFNHGFNFNEAVNFALPDWLEDDLRCIERYREIKKNPVFSHDELLITIAQWERDPRTASWLSPHIREMVDRELELRERIRASESAPDELVEPFDRVEEEYQCEHCKTMCYLSQIITEDARSIACLDHGSTLPTGTKILRIRFTDAELSQLASRVHNRALKASRLPEPTTGTPEAADAPRQSGRKRKPSAALLEAAGEMALPAAQRVKVIHEESEESDEDDEEQAEDAGAQENGIKAEDMPIEQGDIAVDPALSFAAPAPAPVAAPPPVAAAANGDIIVDSGVYTPQRSPSPQAGPSYASSAYQQTQLRFSPPRPGPSSMPLPPVSQAPWGRW
ncbi:hypothetical protein NBRC10512_001529 [Rhodotorula toruloides]|uniref:[histone H3]-trimethyl-L-lysine(4) demethylase n=2 Tax=Rhodotorula toruloides TaxID=5286 RepID=A0A061B850_RHOTO|nr:histone demethylase JARID1 [Rhodotorula toruloides NP11]EMS25285.1 histone demethylase JARID1 [Rhodotorula toruloides NP11]CDR43083.1 RHTO0S07e08064g1_1 [Rhodotorula toruloides]